MVWLSLLSLLAIAGVVVLPRFRRLRDKHTSAVDFLVTLVATFCGVAWAISLDVRASQDQERKAVARLIEVARRDVLVEAGMLAIRAAGDDQSAKHHDVPTDSGATSPQQWPYSREWDSILSNEAVVRGLSATCFRKLQERRLSYSMAENVEARGHALAAIAGILQVEARYQGGGRKLSERRLTEEVSRAEHVAYLADSVDGSWAGLRRRGRVELQALFDSLFNELDGWESE